MFALHLLDPDSLSSLNLLKGHLDQVDEKAYFSWVQPRVLSPEQIGTLAKRLQTWGDRLNGVEWPSRWKK